MQVNVADAKRDLSKLIRLLETKAENDIIVAGNGKPVAKIPHFRQNCVISI